jgi:hypothetical protein
LDTSGNTYVTGGTGSDDFPTVNPIQDSFRGGTGASYPKYFYGLNLGPGDAFVAKFNDTGQMTFGTYLGGSGDEAGFGIALDAAGSIYVTGGTESTDFDIVNPFQDANAGQFDDFVARIGEPQLPPEPVGGIVVPVSKSELLLPGLGLTALVSLAALAIALVRRRRA